MWLDPREKREITVVVKVTAANFHGEFSKPFKLKKCVLEKNVFDLIVRSDGKPIVNPLRANAPGSPMKPTNIRIVLLIDCDNVRCNAIEGVLAELAKHGTINVGHAHRDW